MRIQHNIMAMNAYRNYTNNVSAMKKNLEKLSSGYKINRAGDDAAGLAISEKMRAQITGLQQAQANAKSGINLVQTAEGALTEVHDMLNRMVKLADQSANGTYDVDTDRNQMQKEINQLLEEINRIADSSNFNGINLLDGTLGLNKAAFTSFDAVAAEKATDGKIDLSKLLSAEDAGPTITHLETDSADADEPAAKINLGTLEIKAAKLTGANKANDGVHAVLTINGVDVTVKLATVSASAGATYTAGNIAAALQTALQDGTNADLKDKTKGICIVKASGKSVATAAAGTNLLKIGNAAYLLGNDGSLEYKGHYTKADDLTTFKAETTFSGDAATAALINEQLGFSVTVKEVKGKNDTITNTGAITYSGDVIHQTTNVNEAVAEKAASLAGIDLKLTSDIVQNGNKLTIDGVDYYFKTGSDDLKDEKGNTISTNVIDVSAAKTDEDRIHLAVDLLSAETVAGQDIDEDGNATANGRTWAIAAKSGDTIHIDQTAAATDTDDKVDSYKKLTSLISAQGEAKDATKAGTKITVDSSKVAEGNTLSITKDGVTTKYVFTTDLEGKEDSTGVKYVEFTKGGDDALKNLATKLGIDEDSEDLNETAGTVIVRSAEAKGKSPLVLGKGLTLQIGDTSDSFNQLNVAVQDMHAKALGIDSLDISTEEAAQLSIDKIKAAINTVSDVRGTLGATQNRLDHTINNLSVMTENIQDAESTIRDTDVAEEMMAYTKNNILIQSAQAMLAQANQVPQGVLQLLG